MRTMRVPLACLALAACGAVEVPSARSYRLPLPPGAAIARPAPQVLRVHDLRLAPHLSPDCLMVADGPSLLQPYPLDLWAGPLDRMVTDVVVRSLRRARAFADVKDGADVGAEDLVLTATITDFHYARRGEAAEALVAFDLQIRRASDHALLAARELSARAPAASATAPAAVAALGEAVQDVVAQLVVACSQLPPSATGERGRVPGLAAPPTGR